MKVIETQAFVIRFDLDKNCARDEIFSINKFNYGGGSFYQKFKNHVPSSFHGALKNMKDLDVYIQDGYLQSFEFRLVSSSINVAYDLAKNLAYICKKIHNYDDSVQVYISEIFVAENTISKIYI